VRIPILSRFMATPFDGLHDHAEKVKECTWAYQQAIECRLAKNCPSFEEHRQKVITLRAEADDIMAHIQDQIEKGTMGALDKFQLLEYLRAQDDVLKAVEDSLNWVAYKEKLNIPEKMKKNFLLLFEAIIEPIEELSEMTAEAKKYFKNFSDKQRDQVTEMIKNLRQMEKEADKVEHKLKQGIFALKTDAITKFHLIRLSEITGAIADHAEKAGYIMSSLLVK